MPEKRNRCTYWEGRNEMLPSHRQCAVYIDISKKLQECASWFRKVTEYKVNITKELYLHIYINREHLEIASFKTNTHLRYIAAFCLVLRVS